MKKLVVILSAGLILAACGQTEEKHDHAKQETASVEPVKVALSVPEKAEAGHEVKLTAKVTQNGKAINDADEVMFEIIKDGDKDKSTKKMVKEAKDGVYELPYTFDKDGSYQVISHVTAKSQHTMPDKTILIGEAKHNEHAHHEGAIHVMPIKAVKGEPTEFMIHVKDEAGKAKAELMTRLEVMMPDGKAKWVDLKEIKAGQYEGQETFDEAGKYTVTAHAENKEGFHVHTDATFTVK